LELNNMALAFATFLKGFGSFITSPFGRILLALAAVTAVLAAAYHAGDEHGRAVVGADRDRWKATAGQFRASAIGWEKNFRWDAKLRDQERDEAIASIKAAGRACDARVEAARKTTSAIQSIITRETIYDQAHCPVRRGVGFDSLRDATGLAAGD
jgi:hypothetical protein